MVNIKKILAVSPQELFFRLRRERAIIQERLGFHTTKKIRPESIEMSTYPLLGFEKDKNKVIEYLHSRFPQEVEKIIQKAQHVLERRFDLLGYENLSFGEDIDWAFEPIRKKKIPLVHWSKILQMETDEVGDLKVVWELNRHQHLITLGQAYFVTDNKKYAEEIIKQILDWNNKNPLRKGPNWASSLEVAFRLISWIWSIRLIRKSPICDKEFLRQLAGWIGEHANHIERYLSFYFSPNTHLTGEALGLFYAGVFFPDLPEAPRWKKKGEDILFEMLPVHLLKDGGYTERTLWYHQYTISFYVHFFIMLESLGRDIPKWALEKLEEGVSFLMYSLKPDRTIPMIGDDDGGFFLPLSPNPFNDPGGILAIAAALFRRGDFKVLAGTSRPETLWVLGIDGEETYQNIVEKLPEETSKAFKETGYFFLRSGWDVTSNYMAFDCGPHGWMNCGHAHADLLSLNVVSGENSVIEDPGTYLYINENGWRDLFRGPKNHATLYIDGKPFAIPSDTFHWQNIPVHKLHRFYTGPNHDYVAGSMIVDEATEITREIHFLKPCHFLVIDTIKSDTIRNIEARFPLSAGKWSISDIGCWQEERENPCGIIPLKWDGIEPHFEPSWVSPFYGKKEATNTLVLKRNGAGVFRIACFIDLSGIKPLEKPSIIFGTNVFTLLYKGECCIGFGIVGSKESIKEDEIETDYKAGLINISAPTGITVRGMHDGSYLYFRGKEIEVIT